MINNNNKNNDNNTNSNKQHYESLLSHQQQYDMETIVTPITQSPTVCIYSSRYFIKWGIVGIILSTIITIIPEPTITNTVSSMYITIIWSISQLFIPNNSSLYNRIQNSTWEYWETTSSLQSKQLYDLQHKYNNTGGITESSMTKNNNNNQLLQIPIVFIQQHYNKDGTINSTSLLQYIQQTYGNDWKKRPMLFKNLWTNDELQLSSSKTKKRRRHLSMEGLLQEELIIPYFIDASISNLVTPDGIGSIKDIIYNITKKQKYHKIGTQLFVQKYPHLINEIIPIYLVTTLFGNYFTEQHIQHQSLLGIKLPPLTTVPIFIAGTTSKSFINRKKTTSSINNNYKEQSKKIKWAHTGLHCEPIGNIAVQINGNKQWILIQSHYSNLLRPSLSKDGRAFFTSSLSYESIINSNNDNTTSTKIPHYTTTISPGDALWVPPWTWHRVDYISSSSSSSEEDTTSTTTSTTISIGASVFHFRFFDYILNNPLYSILAIPAIVLEVFGYKTQ